MTTALRPVAELELRDDILRAFFDETSLPYAVVEVDGDDLRYLKVNAAAASFLGRAQDQVVGFRASEVGYTRAVLDPWLALIAEAFAEGKPRRTLFSVGARNLSSVIIPLETGPGELPRFGFITEDVTEKSHLRSQLEISQRRAMVASVAAGAVHEIKNPLAFVVANVAFVREQLDVGPQGTPDLLEALEQAADGLKTIAGLSNDLLALSRDRPAGIQAVDARAVLNRVIALTRVEVRKTASTRLDLDELPEVLADELRLEQVLLNLVLNAVDAMRAHPRPSHLLLVRARLRPDAVELEVVDTGPGIEPDHLEKIFEPFFSTKGDAGTGLGLSLSADAVRAMGGALSARSTPGEGAIFTVRLPVAPAP